MSGLINDSGYGKIIRDDRIAEKWVIADLNQIIHYL